MLALCDRPALPPMLGDIRPYGYDGRYRLFTRGHVDFDTVPAYSDGGPSKVTVSDWSVSYMTNGTAGAQLNARNLVTGERVSVWFADTRACERHAYRMGALAFMAYVKHYPEGL